MENTSHIPRLDRMPGDILLRIFLHDVDPDDIISLRLTCTWFSAVTKDITVWRHACRRACYRHGIVFPIHKENTASAEELEHIATSHYKVSARLRNVHVDPTLAGSESDSTRIKKLQPASQSHGSDLLIPPLELEEDDGGDTRAEYTSLAMAPGGRFVVATDSRFTLRLWDLAHLGDDGLNPTLVSQTELERPFDERNFNILIKLQCGAVKRKSIERLVVLVTLLRPTWVDTRGVHLVYYVDSLDPRDSIFELIGEYEFTENISDSPRAEWFHPESDCLIVQGFDLHIWNYERDTVATLSDLQERRIYGRDVLQAAFINNKLIVWLPRFSVQIYDAYPSCFYPKDAEPDEDDFPDYDTKITLVPTGGLDDKATYTTPHYDHIEDTLVSHLLGTREDDAPVALVHCHRLTIEDVASEEFPNEGTCYAPPDIGAFDDMTNKLFYTQGSKLATFNLPYQDLALLWTDAVKEGLYFKVLSNNEVSDILVVTPAEGQVFSTHKRLGMVTVSFCPFSGRLCYVDKSLRTWEDYGHPCIRVVDYA